MAGISKILSHKPSKPKLCGAFLFDVGQFDTHIEILRSHMFREHPTSSHCPHDHQPPEKLTLEEEGRGMGQNSHTAIWI